MAKIYKDKEGRKLYPVCRWEPNQHKMHNAVDRAYLDMVDSDYEEQACDRYEKAVSLLEAFDRYVINGLVYAPYIVGAEIKDRITAYDVRGDLMR